MVTNIAMRGVLGGCLKMRSKLACSDLHSRGRGLRCLNIPIGIGIRLTRAGGLSLCTSVKKVIRGYVTNTPGGSFGGRPMRLTMVTKMKIGCGMGSQVTLFTRPKMSRRFGASSGLRAVHAGHPAGFGLVYKVHVACWPLGRQAL